MTRLPTKVGGFALTTERLDSLLAVANTQISNTLA